MEPYTRRCCQTPRRWTCPMLLRQQPSGCVTWGINFFWSTRRQRRSRPEGHDWQILRQVSPTQSHQSNGAAEKAVSTVRGLAGTYLAVPKEKIPSFEVSTHSPILPCTIGDAAWGLTRYNVRRDTRMTPYEKIRGQKDKKEILPLGEQALARLPGANVNQLLQPWVSRLWLERDTLSDEHLVGTAAGVMRSRAVRRLQETARWVPAALKAMLFTPWSPHRNLPGRPRLQRTAYEEPIEARALPRFIEIPTAPTSRHPKLEAFVTTPGDAEQSTKRQRQEVTFREPQRTSSSSGAAADTSMQILIHRYRNLHVHCHPLSEKTVSKSVRGQRK